MIRPTIEKIDEIIYKLKELQTTIANIEDRPLEFPESQENNSNSLSIEQLINAVGQKSAGESIDTLKQVLQKSLIDGFSSYPQNSNQATTQVLAKLPSLSQSRLKKLLKDDIPQILADERISEVKKQVWHGESPFTEEAQNLHFIQKEIDQQIQKNIEAAKAARRQKHVKPIINEIERVLFPYWDYFKEHGSYRLSENLILMEIIRQGNLSGLPEVINEFERIKYKLEVESQQSAPQKPAETKPDIPPIEKEKEKVKTIGSVKIQSFTGILGDVQAENLQIGDNAQIDKKPEAEKPAETEPDTTLAKCWRIVKKITGWIFKKTSRLIGVIIGGLIVAVLIDIFGDFGWIERIKAFIYEIIQLN